MVRISINLSFGIAGLVSCISTDAVQAGSTLSANTDVSNKLYHDRKGSKIEEFFRKLTSIESEVDSIFDDASYFSSFGASPQVEQKNEPGSGRSFSPTFPGTKPPKFGTPQTLIFREQNERGGYFRRRWRSKSWCYSWER